MDSMFTIAVHSLVYLNHKKAIISSLELSKNICANPARVRKAMSKLKKAQIINTKEGINGGYSLARDAKDITLYSVAKELEISFVGMPWKTGDKDMDCLIASGMADVMGEIYLKLDKECYSYLKNTTIEDIDKIIFK